MKYVISSTSFTDLEKVLKQLSDWEKDGYLDEKAMVYEVKKEYKIVKNLSLQEVKK